MKVLKFIVLNLLLNLSYGQRNNSQICSRGFCLPDHYNKYDVPLDSTGKVKISMLDQDWLDNSPDLTIIETVLSSYKDLYELEKVKELLG